MSAPFGVPLPFCLLRPFVIASVSEAVQRFMQAAPGLLRRFTPRNDEDIRPFRFCAAMIVTEPAATAGKV
jgi:hypothetical protein